ncbi:MAG: hypothetical protein ACRENK_12200 [Gemmatimonadaceae bacterium]
MLRTITQPGRPSRDMLGPLAAVLILASIGCARNEGAGAAGDTSAAASSTSASAAACPSNNG